MSRQPRTYDETVEASEAGSGWQPIRRPARSWAARAVAPLHGPSPFARLAMVHVVSISGDTLVTTALAGSLFFSISPGAARGRVALYLALTMAPFAVVAPLLGPALDRSRGGRRIVVVVSQLGRALVCLVMAGHLHSLLLFPEAFAVLVLSKAYTITKSALVPAAVADESGLVQANSRLAVLAVVAGFVAAGPGILVLKIGFLGAPWVLRLAALVFLAATVAAVRLVRTPIARPPVPGAVAQEALKSAGIVLAASAMAVLRGVVGFCSPSASAGPMRRRGGSGSPSPPAWAAPSSEPSSRPGCGGLSPRSASSPPRCWRWCWAACSGPGSAAGGPYRRWRGSWVWPRAPASWPSTRSSSATLPMRPGAAPSPASRPSSSWRGWSEPSSRSSSRSPGAWGCC